jgi:hypothetical protein
MSTHGLGVVVLLVAVCLITCSAQEPKASELNDPIPTLSKTDMARQTISCKPIKIKQGCFPKVQLCL